MLNRDDDDDDELLVAIVKVMVLECWGGKMVAVMVCRAFMMMILAMLLVMMMTLPLWINFCPICLTCENYLYKTLLVIKQCTFFSLQETKAREKIPGELKICTEAVEYIILK